jgi:alpha-beta hydrolase superfamily lysophospholipase
MRIRRTAGVVAASCVGAGAAAVAVGRYASRFALDPRREVVPDGAPLTVHDVAADRVTLTRSLAAARPGVHGLAGDGVHACVGPVLATAPDTVTRELRTVSQGTLKPGARVHLTPQLYRGDPFEALGIEYGEDPVEGELGPLPAWFVPGDRDTWIITVHGLGATREQPLTVLPFLHDLGFPVLDISHRNDPGAPPSPDRIAHLGDTEWHDVDAAVRHAVHYGAERVVLYGWSTGAAMALRAADHSPSRGRIAGLVLDSPVLDWQAVVRAVARRHGVPGVLLPLATRAAAGRTGLHADRLAGSADPDRLQVPAFLAHGPGDSVAPFRASRQFAARRPELVTLHTVPGAEHQAMWNADPVGYEEALRRFLTPLM